jgi:hypothetical protein
MSEEKKDQKNDGKDGKKDGEKKEELTIQQRVERIRPYLQTLCPMGLHPKGTCQCQPSDNTPSWP